MSQTVPGCVPLLVSRVVEKTAEELDICVDYHDNIEAFQDRYLHGDKLGSGGFGSVYRGSRIDNFKPIIIKEIDSSRVPCWCRLNGVLIPLEVVLLSKARRLSGVVQLLDVFNFEDKWYIVMDGNKDTVCDMFDYICERGTLGETESAYIMYQLIGILLQCHSTGILHRDLKDENLLIDKRSKEIQLIDFGSGAILHDNLYTDFDGTRVYCPPEWIESTSYYGKSAEVWSLGVLLFDMLNGDVPFVSDKAITSGHLHFRKCGLSEDVKHLMHSCMNLDAHARPTLIQILQHPWMKQFRGLISRSSSPSVHLALTESSMVASSPLTTSVSLRPDLCDLVPEGQQNSIDERPLPPTLVSHCTVIGAFDGDSSPQPVSAVNGEMYPGHMDSLDEQENNSPLHNAEPLVSELSRANSSQSHASSGYCTRCNSFCFEDERNKGATEASSLMSDSQSCCPESPSSGIVSHLPWRKRANTGSSTGSGSCNINFKTLTVKSLPTPPDLPSVEHPISGASWRCTECPNSSLSANNLSREISLRGGGGGCGGGVPLNALDGIMITVSRHFQDCLNRGGIP